MTRRFGGLAAAALLAVFAVGTAAAQQRPITGQHFYVTPDANLAQFAISNGKFAMLPEGFRNFVPVASTYERRQLTEIVCPDMGKVIALHKYVRIGEVLGLDPYAARAFGLESVIRLNGNTAVCWQQMIFDTTDATAIRGYEEDIGGQKVLRAVKIHRLNVNGQTVYGGSHL